MRGSSQSCAARGVFWVGHEKLHESETKKRKENVFMMSCSLEVVVRQRTGTAPYLMVRGRSLGDSLGTGCAQAVLLTCLLSTLCLASVALIAIRSRRVTVLCTGGGLG